MKFGLIAALLFFAQSAIAAAPIHAQITTSKKTIPLTLELATTPEQRETGLMNRTTLKPNDGMLFLFPHTSHLWFWMKNTLIPLDMLFIDANGVIVHIGADEVPLSLTEVDSEKPILTVIELAGGRAAKDGIHVGDHVTYQLPEDIHAQ